MDTMEESYIENFHDENNDHEKTYVTVHADSFTEKDFDNFLDCLDTIRETEKTRRNVKKSIKNYCVQVPYIDNSIMNDDNEVDQGPSDDFEKTCDDMKDKISEMFSYFDEDVHLNYDDYDTLSCDLKRSPTVRHNQTPIASIQTKKDPSENFREKFLRNRQKIRDEMGEASEVDTKPIIRGAIKKRNAPSTPNSSLNKNQVDKIMNEFNRVKINYYSKENYVEFTNIDYFYCDSSDRDSMRSEKIGKSKKEILSMCKTPEVDRKSTLKATKIVPKNSVRDKIDMFSKLDTVIKPFDGALVKSMSAPISVTRKEVKMVSDKIQRQAPTLRMKSIFKNTSAGNKNQNKCFISDINNSLLNQVKKDEESIRKPPEIQDGEKFLSTNVHKAKSIDLLSKFVNQLNDVDLLMKLERIVNKFGMSLLHTIDGLMNDDAFTLAGNRMKHLSVETHPSIEHFNEIFDDELIDMAMDNTELSVVDTNKIQLQMQVTIDNRATLETTSVKINVIFTAQYETDACTVPPTAVGRNTFFIYFTSLFEVFTLMKFLGEIILSAIESHYLLFYYFFWFKTVQTMQPIATWRFNIISTTLNFSNYFICLFIAAARK